MFHGWSKHGRSKCFSGHHLLYIMSIWFWQPMNQMWRPLFIWLVLWGHIIFFFKLRVNYTIGPNLCTIRTLVSTFFFFPIKFSLLLNFIAITSKLLNPCGLKCINLSPYFGRVVRPTRKFFYKLIAYWSKHFYYFLFWS